MTMLIMTDDRYSDYVLGDYGAVEMTSRYEMGENDAWERWEVEEYSRQVDDVPDFVKYEEESEEAVGFSDSVTSYIARWWVVALD